MKQQTLEKGDIVQLNPKHTHVPAFAGCLMVVSDPKAWGAVGYVQALGRTKNAESHFAYYRASWEEMEPTGGKAQWIQEE